MVRNNYIKLLSVRLYVLSVLLLYIEQTCFSLCRGGYIFVTVCLLVGLSVCLLTEFAEVCTI